MRESSLYKKLWVYRNIAPVFSYFLVMIFAFLLGNSFEVGVELRYGLYSLSLAFLILAIQYNRKFFSLCFFFCFSLLYYDYRVDLAGAELPEVEATLGLSVNAINRTSDRYISGYATTFEAYDLDLQDKEIFFVVYGKEQGIDIGDKLKLRGVLKPVGQELSTFDSFLSRQKISYRFISSEDKVEVLPLGYFAQGVQNIRAYIAKGLENSSPEYARYLPMYRALMIGDMSRVDKADKQIFARSASIHIFAISGLHVGLVASLLLLIFNFLRLPYVASILLSLVFLYVYVQVCGAKPSAMRAYMMLFFVALAYVFNRKANSFNALLLSASIALLYEPKLLFNVGFLLSYCVVGSIILYGLSLYTYLLKSYKPYAMLSEKLLSSFQRWIRKFYLYLLMSFCISFSAFLGGGLLCSHFFGYVSWASIVNFIIFIPLVSLILPLGFLSIFMPSFLARIINDFILLLLEFMTNIAKFFSDANFIMEIRVESVYLLIVALVVLFAALIYLKDKQDLRLVYVPACIFGFTMGISYVLERLYVVE